MIVRALAVFWQHGPADREVATWAGMIVLFLFGKLGFENIAPILKR
ncbi:MAG TPA: hypothetical protein VFK79_04400 [Xanthobacteraceae bacterium]|nr:hypothetical protein [Xanthobacteraceae bacterium]